LFDDSEADVVRKKCFAINVWEQWQKKITEKTTSHFIAYSDYLADMVEKFRLKTRLEVPWLHEDDATKVKNQTEILFKMAMYKGEKDRYVIKKRFYGKGAKGDKVYDKLNANKPPTGRTSKAYEKMLYNEIHVAVAGVHGLTLVKSSVGKRKREEVQTPAQEIEIEVEENVTCAGNCAQDLTGMEYHTLPCGHKWCFKCIAPWAKNYRFCPCHPNDDIHMMPEAIVLKYGGAAFKLK